jgi:transposase
MPKNIEYTLNADELAVVRRAMVQDRRPEVRHRATALHLLHRGKKPDEVAEMLAVTLGSIYKWHARWRSEGLDGLANQPKSGAPVKADEAYWQRVERLLEMEPLALGYDFTVWTVERLICHMQQETGIHLSLSRFRTVLQQRGYVYRRPKHDLKSLQDAEARQAAESWLEELKKEPWTKSSTSSLWTSPP